MKVFTHYDDALQQILSSCDVPLKDFLCTLTGRKMYLYADF